MLYGRDGILDLLISCVRLVKRIANNHQGLRYTAHPIRKRNDMIKNETDEEYITRVNGYTNEEIDVMISEDKCPYEPERDGPSPQGMYHCPLCGEMVLSNCPHPRYKDIEYKP